MENPTTVKQKIVLSSGDNVPHGAGIKAFQVNDPPVTDVLTIHGKKETSGSKYLNDVGGPDVTVGNLPYITDASATVWTAVASTTGVTNTIQILGVNENLDEVSENITLNGLTPVASVNKYKCINDLRMNGGGAFASGVFCYVTPSGGPSELRVSLSSTTKTNPFIMVGRKNGVDRKARLRSLTTVYNASASTSLAYHVFRYNVVQPGTNKGVSSVALQMFEVPAGTSHDIEFSKDGAVELKMGEMAVWYRASASTTATYICSTWSFHNV
jgi:hypothetical protein